MKTKHLPGLALVSLIGLTAFFSIGSAVGVNQEESDDICSRCHDNDLDQSAPQVRYGAINASAHIGLSCSDCHVGVEANHGATVPAVDCSACHKSNAEAFQLGIHWKLLARGSQAAPDCVDCHGSHDIGQLSQGVKSIHDLAILDTCGQCHEKQKNEFIQSSHGAAFEDLAKRDFAPVCTSCHNEHAIFDAKAPGSPVSASKMPDTCGGCHEDPAFAEALSIPGNRQSSYEDTIHGLRNRFGKENVATCEDCHGYHLVLPQADQRSLISETNIIGTCGKCHEGANANLTASKVHIEATVSSSPGVFVVRWFYILFIAVLAIGFVIHIAFDVIALKRRREGRNHE